MFTYLCYPGVNQGGYVWSFLVQEKRLQVWGVLVVNHHPSPRAKDILNIPEKSQKLTLEAGLKSWTSVLADRAAPSLIWCNSRGLSEGNLGVAVKHDRSQEILLLQ